MTARSSEFARRQTGALLERLSDYAAAVAESPDADAVHDLRVTIRRFKAALRVFRSEFDRRETKKVRRRLDAVLDAAGAVRDRDIALHLLEKAGIPADSALVRELERQREEAREILRRATGGTMAKKSAARLGI